MMRRGGRATVIVAGLLAAAFGGPKAAGGQEVRVEARQGYDTNVFEISSSGDSARVDTYYSRLTLGYEYETRSRPWTFRLRPEARVKWYPESSSGNQYGVGLEMRLRNEWRNPAEKPRVNRRLYTYLQVTGGYDRELFLKRETREEFNTGLLGASTSIADLPGRASAAGELRVRSEWTKAVTLEAGVVGEWNDYTDASGSTGPSFERLDSREFGAFAGSTVELPGPWEVGGEARWRSRVYPNREARDADGSEVPGETRRFFYWDFELQARVRAGILRNTLILDYRRRDDRLEDYYSYDAWAVGDEVELPLGRRVDFEVGYTFGRKSYDLFAPSGEPTENDYHDAKAGLKVDVARGTDFTVGTGYERARSNDPLFDYERMDAFVEVRVRR